MKREIADYFSENPKLKQLLIIGAITHLLTAFLVVLIGHLQIFPSQILDSGILFGDAILYLQKSQELSLKIYEGDFSFLFTNEFDLHLRIYILAYSLFSGIFRNSILCFEAQSISFYF